MAAGQQSEVAVGIDLGTTYSCVAIWQRNRVTVISNDQGLYVTPSCVAFAGSEKLVGNSAFNQAASNPSNTVFAIKRLMGRRWEEQSVQDDIKLWPFRVVQGRAGRPMVVVQFKGEEKKFTAEEISSMILVKMKEIAETFLGCTVKNAVITVPAYFNYSQRRATKDAGEIAGLTVMRIINEPTAVAFAYGLDKMPELGSRQKYILIFDLGGVTLDVTILLMKQDLVEVKSTAGNPHLGGEDFDSRMVSYMASEFKKKKKLDISENPLALRRLRTACEKAKLVLYFQRTTTVEVDSLMNGVDLHIDITRAKFEELNADLFDNCKVVLEQCINDVKGVTKDSIDDVVLVGGSSRIPKIQDMLKEYFNRDELCRSINPDVAVVQGAAIQAAKLMGVEVEDVHSLVLLGVTPLSLGMETRGGVMTVLVDRNTPVPVKREKVFSAAVDEQTSVEVKVFQGERTLTKDNHLLGVFTLELPPMPERVPHINISFEIDANGILTVTAEEKSNRLKKEMVVANDYGRLTAEEIERMVRDGETYRREDELRRKVVEARNGLEAYISSVKHKVQGGKPSLSSREKEKVQAALDRASEWFERNPDAEARQYEDARKELERVWTDVVGSRG